MIISSGSLIINFVSGFTVFASLKTLLLSVGVKSQGAISEISATSDMQMIPL